MLRKCVWATWAMLAAQPRCERARRSRRGRRRLRWWPSSSACWTTQSGCTPTAGGSTCSTRCCAPAGSGPRLLRSPTVLIASTSARLTLSSVGTWSRCATSRRRSPTMKPLERTASRCPACCSKQTASRSLRATSSPSATRSSPSGGASTAKVWKSSTAPSRFISAWATNCPWSACIATWATCARPRRSRSTRPIRPLLITWRETASSAVRSTRPSSSTHVRAATITRFGSPKKVA
mmetsp:Transcript_8453/g.26834  ORF Transcript_8453/g.26834 Transcript_8453/m.26834 type:complete len:236 (+) Transcript_8453:2747-3454(+)